MSMNTVSPNELFSLRDRRALVTGAGKGIGRAISLAYAAAGASVTLCARTEEDLRELAGEISAAGGKAEIMPCDISDVSGFAALIAEREPFHILVNNAGVNRPKPLTDVSEDDYDAVLGLNLRAAIFVAKAVTARMLKAGVSGSIINISSQMGHVGAANRTLYCASKWAIEGFTKALAVELAPANIRVNTICPTFIETPFTEPMFRDPTFRAQILEKIKLGRIGQVDDIVGAAIFLASNASSLMTGSAVMLDGGWTAE